MSWIAGSMLVLGAVIVVGFVWYERTHPSTRVIALVATLAAMAALGRVAFAASERQADDRHRADRGLHARRRARLHGRRRRRARVNLFFGQGPWTPWQMVGWGGVGPVRRGARARQRPRPRPVPLAAACGVAGSASAR